MAKALKYAVDIPNPNNPDDVWVNMDYFENKKQAIQWARKHLGADAKGRICVVSKMPKE